MATSCVPGYRLNTAQLEQGEKKREKKCQQEELMWESQTEADPTTCPPEFRSASWTWRGRQIPAAVIVICRVCVRRRLFSGCARGWFSPASSQPPAPQPPSPPSHCSLPPCLPFPLHCGGNLNCAKLLLDITPSHKHAQERPLCARLIISYYSSKTAPWRIVVVD